MFALVVAKVSSVKNEQGAVIDVYKFEANRKWIRQPPQVVKEYPLEGIGHPMMFQKGNVKIRVGDVTLRFNAHRVSA